MLAKAGQTAGPNGLTFFEGTHGYPEGPQGIKIFLSKIFFFSKIYWQRRALQFVNNSSKLQCLQTYYSF